MAPAIAYLILAGLLGSAIWFRTHTLDPVQDESTFGEWPHVPFDDDAPVHGERS